MTTTVSLPRATTWRVKMQEAVIIMALVLGFIALAFYNDSLAVCFGLLIASAVMMAMASSHECGMVGFIMFAAIAVILGIVIRIHPWVRTTYVVFAGIVVLASIFDCLKILDHFDK